MARGLLPRVSSYSMMSCCSREVGHGTCRENMPLDLRMQGGDGWAGGWGGCCHANGLGQEQLCLQFDTQPLWLGSPDGEQHMGVERGQSSHIVKCIYEYRVFPQFLA